MSEIRLRGLPPGFRRVGPIYRTEYHVDGTIVNKVCHENGVSDVVVERQDGTVVESIEGQTTNNDCRTLIVAPKIATEKQ